MKHLVPIVSYSLVAGIAAAEAPKVFTGLLEPGVPRRGQIGMVLPPLEINKYVAKVEAAARKDVKWFREYSANAKPGVPLPYDERIGLTKEEYAEYLALWNKREFKPADDVTLLLREGAGNSWVISATGGASALSTLRYDSKADLFRSPNGELKRIEDIKSDPDSVLGQWTGSEWRFEEETTLGKTKENFAIGRLADAKTGQIVYRVQELSTEGTRLIDKSLVIRFPLAAAKPATSAKPAPVKVMPKKK
jgi:hypothetical protein